MTGLSERTLQIPRLIVTYVSALTVLDYLEVEYKSLLPTEFNIHFAFLCSSPYGSVCQELTPAFKPALRAELEKPTGLSSTTASY